ncbi:MAG: DUF2203 domain-containing protein [Chloroflexia bacterium]
MVRGRSQSRAAVSARGADRAYRAEPARRPCQEALLEIEAQAGSNGHALGEEKTFRRKRLLDAPAQVRQGIEQIHALGCEIKDIETGLLDFPSELDGREILLCWRLDEPSVQYWHDRDQGFASRRPV